jgi:thymidylate synthase (FAD)
MRDRHGAPSEHNSMTFFVSAPIFVFREFQRHRVGFCDNEERPIADGVPFVAHQG